MSLLSCVVLCKIKPQLNTLLATTIRLTFDITSSPFPFQTPFPYLNGPSIMDRTYGSRKGRERQWSGVRGKVREPLTTTECVNSGREDGKEKHFANYKKGKYNIFLVVIRNTTKIKYPTALNYRQIPNDSPVMMAVV